MVVQGARNETSRNLLALSGSGSLDFSDVADHGDLASLVTRGAVREMQEEARVPEHLVGPTRLIGYGRWLERGAKPEFFAFTELLGTKAEVTAGLERLGSHERIYTGGIEWVPFADALAAVQGNDLSASQQEFLQAASLPLIVALRKCVALEAPFK